MSYNKEAAIEHFITTARDRDFKTALRDAVVCCESRGTTGKIPGSFAPAPPCDCFCCSLTTTLRRRGWDIRLAAGLYKPIAPYDARRGFGNG
jgi:hypothetical protein